MRILHLFRPTVPSVRAQVLQVVHTCQALAARGHEVTLLCNPAPDAPRDVDRLLETWGLPPTPGLLIRLAPSAWSPASSLWFRWSAGEWADRAGKDALVYARELRYVGLAGERVPVVYEAHCLERARAADEGEEPGPVEAMERTMLARAAGLVANSGGTLTALREAYGAALPPKQQVIHNATRGDRAVGPPAAVQSGALPRLTYAGSARAYKGLAGVIAALGANPDLCELRLVGTPPAGPLPANVRAVGEVAYGELPARLAESQALLLALDDNDFGRRFTSPLKLFDYLATGLPIVAANLPTVREIAGDIPHYYQPGSADSLVAAVRAALAAPPRAPQLRTWADRAAELDAFLTEVRAHPRRADAR